MSEENITMTDQETKVIEFYNELQKYFGDSLANPEQEPRRFESQIRLYRHLLSRQNVA